MENFLNKILPLITVLVWLLSWVINDRNRLSKSYWILDHTTRYLLRGSFMFICFIHSVELGIISFCMFFCFFDFLLNKARGFKWSYHGTVEITDRKFGFMLLPKIILFPVLVLNIICFLNDQSFVNQVSEVYNFLVGFISDSRFF